LAAFSLRFARLARGQMSSLVAVWHESWAPDAKSAQAQVTAGGGFRVCSTHRRWPFAEWYAVLGCPCEVNRWQIGLAPTSSQPNPKAEGHSRVISRIEAAHLPGATSGASPLCGGVRRSLPKVVGRRRRESCSLVAVLPYKREDRLGVAARQFAVCVRAQSGPVTVPVAFSAKWGSGPASSM